MVEEGKIPITYVKNRKQQQPCAGVYASASAVCIRLKLVTWQVLFLLLVLASSPSQGFCHYHCGCRPSSPITIGLPPCRNKKFLLSREATNGSSFLLPFVNGGGDIKELKGSTTLPSGTYRPKQSLGQNFLSDPNYVQKICNECGDSMPGGSTVLELGPGVGALTRILFQKYPKMIAVDIDERSIQLLKEKYQGLQVMRSDVLMIDYTRLATLLGGKLSVIGNLPFNITSQILFSLCDHYRSIKSAVVTTQLEVAQRIVASPGSKDYGILSVVFQLHAEPKLLFRIPPTVFYPQPKVQSALIRLEFTGKGPGVNQHALRRVLSSVFQQRRKMLRQSLKSLLKPGQRVSEKFATRRPEELTPEEFVQLTLDIGGQGCSNEELPGTPTWRRGGPEYGRVENKTSTQKA